MARLDDGIDVDVVLSARRVQRVLLWTCAALVAASVAGQLAVHYLPYVPLKARLAHVLFVDTEQSVPTAFATAGLLAASALLAVIARATRREGGRDARHWLALSVLFVVLAADEYLSLHENDQYLRDALGTTASGYLYYPWVLVGSALVIVTALVFWPFLLRLPADSRRRFLAAGAVFVAGTLGVEMFGAAEAETSGRADLRYGVLATVEEALEMIGVVLFVGALLRHLQEHLGGFALQVRT